MEGIQCPDGPGFFLRDNPFNDSHVAIRLLELRDKVSSLKTEGLAERVAEHLAGLGALVGASRAFLLVVKKEGEKLTPRSIRPSSSALFSAPIDSEAQSREIKKAILSCLSDPLLEAASFGAHRCALLGTPGDEHRILAVYALTPQTDILLGFDRDELPAFSEQDRETIRFALQHQGSFFRRVAREVGALDAARMMSPRELDVIALLLTGLSEKEIAHRLRMTERSTHQRVTAIYRNYGVRSRPELMARLLSEH